MSRYSSVLMELYLIAASRALRNRNATDVSSLVPVSAKLPVAAIVASSKDKVAPAVPASAATSAAGTAVRTDHSGAENRDPQSDAAATGKAESRPHQLQLALPASAAGDAAVSMDEDEGSGEDKDYEQKEEEPSASDESSGPGGPVKRRKKRSKRRQPSVSPVASLLI